MCFHLLVQSGKKGKKQELQRIKKGRANKFKGIMWRSEKSKTNFLGSCVKHCHYTTAQILLSKFLVG